MVGCLPIKYLSTRQTGKKALKSTIQLSLSKGQKLIIDVFDSYNLSLYQINTLDVVQDARGRWYACITVKDFPKQVSGKGSVGIDLGLKDSATTSNGDKLTTKQTQKWAKKLAIAQSEPPRLYRRLIYLSQAAMPDRVKLS